MSPPVKMLIIYVAESDLWGDAHTPLYEAMLRRTEQYLLDQRDGKGGFKRNPNAIDQFGRAPVNTTNAYIVWALTESGKEDGEPGHGWRP